MDKDTPPYTWVGKYDPLLRHGGTDFPLINQLRDLLTGTFRIVLRISKIQDNLYINGKPCMVRRNKFDEIYVYPNCTIIKGTPTDSGGSNNHPRISFKEGEATVEVITKGFPHFELETYKMQIEILEFEKLELKI